MEPYASPRCRHFWYPWAKHRIRRFSKIQCSVSGSPGLLVSEESPGWWSSQCSSLRCVGDIPETSKCHPCSTAATAPRPHTGLCQPLEVTTVLWKAGGWLGCHILLHISRLSPFSQPTCCLMSGRSAVSWLIFLLISPGSFTSLASPLIHHFSLPLPSTLSAFPFALHRDNPAKPHPCIHLTICLMSSLNWIQRK